jgi:hypothetical protein
MKKLLVLTALMVSTAAFAQGSPPAGNPRAGSAPAASPAASDPPAAGAKASAAAKSHGAGKPKSIAEKLRACLDIEDGTKGRLDCYDAAIPPKPKPKPGVAKGVLDCRFIKEEDERLTCINGFAESIPKFSQ